MEINCDSLKCRYNAEGKCLKDEGIHIDEIGFCCDMEED